MARSTTSITIDLIDNECSLIEEDDSQLVVSSPERAMEVTRSEVISSAMVSSEMISS